MAYSQFHDFFLSKPDLGHENNKKDNGNNSKNNGYNRKNYGNNSKNDDNGNNKNLHKDSIHKNKSRQQLLRIHLSL